MIKGEKIDFSFFENKFKVFKKCSSDTEISNCKKVLSTVFYKIGGASYNNGLLVLYNTSDSSYFTSIVENYFSKAEGNITCFGRDWLNRQFAIKHDNPHVILQFDIVYNEVIEIPVNLKFFFESELINYTNDLLSEDFFNECRSKIFSNLLCNQCLDYKIPPILGGKDTIENLDVRDADVAWEINSQLHK